MRLGVVLAVVAALFALGLLAGCGDDDDGGSEALGVDEYGTAVNDELTAFNEEFGALGEAAADPASREDYLQAVTAVQDRATETVDQLESIEAPEEVSSFHDDLIAAMRGLEESYTPVIEATEAKDDAALQQAAEGLQTSVTEFNTAATQLGQQADELGLEIPSLTGSTG